MVMDSAPERRGGLYMPLAAAPYIDLDQAGLRHGLPHAKPPGKIEIYRAENIPVYFLAGPCLKPLSSATSLMSIKKIVADYGLTHAEVSDGSIIIFRTPRSAAI